MVREISLTDFVDIVSASGTPKLNKVRYIKRRGPYSPAKDFYRPFREHLINVHRENRVKQALDDVMPFITDSKKIHNYPFLIQGYKKWWGNKNLIWFDPPSMNWSAHNVDVRVNPELGLILNGQAHLIKLYMKSPILTKTRVDIITHLMEISLAGVCNQVTIMSVLDVRRSKLISPTVPIAGLNAALDAELAYINALWPQV